MKNKILEKVKLLTPDEQNEMAAFLVYLRHKKDPDYNAKINKRIDRRLGSDRRSLEDYEKDISN